MSIPVYRSGSRAGTSTVYGSLLRIKSREQFNAYLSDPDYLRLKPLRLAGVTDLAIAEAYGPEGGRLFETLMGAPSDDGLSALVLEFASTQSDAQSAQIRCDRGVHGCFQLTDLEVFVVKGTPPVWLTDVQTVTFRALQADYHEGPTWSLDR
ncbi:MAG: hypothetical protein AAGI12_05280 [Pseudomonadota bacterium]